MSHIPFSSPSPTLYDFLGIPNEEALGSQEDGDLAREQDLSTPESDTKQDTSKPVQIFGIMDEDEAIQFLLSGGSSPEQIVQFVKVHKSSKEAGNHAALDIISGVQPDELPGRIHTVEARLISIGHVHRILPVFATGSPPAIVPTIATVPLPANAHFPEPEIIPATAPVSTRLKREPSEDFEEKPDSSPEGVKRARTTSMDEESDFPDGPEPKKSSEPTTITRRGCPGDFWKCKPNDLEKRTYWTSFKKFRQHFEAYHLENNRTNDYRWKCHLCDHDSFGGNGHGLLLHLWNAHFE
ncbi:unnamed protein product [Alternaria alternata]|nr:hypothetical protein AA0116_g12372 [Alternaria tenuissima]